MLVLASASPRRQELLRNAGIAFIQESTGIPEIPQPGESPKACAERLARDKARSIFAQRPNDVILSADTVVFVNGEILGKPADAADAARMLRLLSGKQHTVITGVCLTGGRSLEAQNPKLETVFEDIRSESTTVTFEGLSGSEIAAYVATGEPMDKAGAYAIQGIASRWISRIEGDYFNVVGLPVSLVHRMLREHGVFPK